MVENRLRDHGLIVTVMMWVFARLQYLSPTTWFYGERLATQGTGDEVLQKSFNRALSIDILVCGCLFIEILLVGFSRPWPGTFIALSFVFCIWRLCDILQATINLVIFDPLRVNGQKSHTTFSVVRTVILSIINYIEIILLFAIYYNSSIAHLNISSSLTGVEGLYFSVVTQFTVGFGDIYPKNGMTKLVVVAHCTIAWFMSIIVISRVVSLIPSPADRPRT